MRLTYNLRGYDKRTDELRFEQQIPIKFVQSLKTIIVEYISDPDLTGTYELDAAKLYRIALLLETPLNPNDYDFFLDSSADWDTIRAIKQKQKA